MNFVYGLGGGLLMAGLHSATGSANDFYEYRFRSAKDPDDIAGFYGGEELMVRVTKARAAPPMSEAHRCHCLLVFTRVITVAKWHRFTRISFALCRTPLPPQELFCIFPFVNKIMMRLASFDDTGRITTQGIPGTMSVDMVFSDETNAEGRTDWFNKRERFKDTLFGYTCWDMVINYGFRTLPDGTYECYHVGE